MSTLPEGLNEEQRRAVECVEGPVLIVAGAGSGKTRVLTSRIAYLIGKGTEPERILALTFTKKAASEMKERIAAMVGERKARRLYMGTFHSVFIRFLRDWSDKLGYPRSFTIYDESDSQSAIKKCVRELGLDEKVYKPRDILSRISKAKNNLCTASAYSRNTAAITNDRIAKRPDTWRVFKLYEELCRKSGVMDFDDILLNMNILLRDCPEALEDIGSRFDHILVDEYQDTNLAQYVILKKLGDFMKLRTGRANICVVGDDSQSIYAFRGAKIENILNFRKDYPECSLFRLVSNYRSTRNIVEAANSLIAKNTARIPKDCVAMAGNGEKLRLIRAYTEQEEATLIASDIVSRIREYSAEYQDFAILYRTNAQSRALEEALRKRNLPYMIWSGNSFFDRAEVKDMMAYLKLAVNPADDVSFRRIVNTPARGIGDSTLHALDEAARTWGVSLMEAVGKEGLVEFGLRPAAIDRLRSFRGMMMKAAAEAVDTDAHRVATSLASESGLYRMYKEDNSVEAQSRAANIEELLNSIASFKEGRDEDYVASLIVDGTVSSADEVDEADIPPVLLSDFLEDISLLSNADVDDDDSSNKIALMTVHSAKGLEFPYVFVSGMEENLFPSGGQMLSESELEEERRLFYVALTRAKKAVTLTFAETRMRNGKHESNRPSRFLREIDPRYVANPLRSEGQEESKGGGTDDYMPGRFRFGSRTDRTPVREVHPRPVATVRPTVNALNHNLPPKIPDSEFIPTPPGELRTGDRIEHNRFGTGRILEITGEAPEMKAKIAFDAYGQKILLLKYAKIRRLPIAD